MEFAVAGGERDSVSTPALDAILVHVPAEHGEVYVANRLAVGLVSIASAAQDAGLSVEVVHTGVERLKDADFDLAGYVAQRQPVVVGFSLHWHYQAGTVLREVEQLGRAYPEAVIVVGGLTGGFYAEEILRTRPEVAAVVVGDGEAPFREFVRSVKSGHSWDGIPNLVWRSGDSVVRNPEVWVASAQQVSAYGFGDLAPLKNAPLYVHLPSVCNRTRPDFLARGGLHLPIGRGCPVECSFCSGSCTSQKLMTGRSRPAVLEAASVARNLTHAQQHGVSHFYLSYHPRLPAPYWEELARACEALGSEVALDLEMWSPPGREMVEAWAHSFTGPCKVILSPDTATNEVRLRSRGFRFTNDDIRRSVECLSANGIGVVLYYAIGLPFQTRDEVLRSMEQADEYRRLDGVQAVHMQALSIEPGAPMWSEPERYGITVHADSFAAFASARLLEAPGYSTAWLSEDEIVELANQWAGP
jgi:radical SAM superfamily enzyme YgiQ (UPF0313 family)